MIIFDIQNSLYYSFLCGLALILEFKKNTILLTKKLHKFLVLIEPLSLCMLSKAYLVGV